MTRKATRIMTAAMVALLVAGGCYAAELAIGDAAPDWSGIVGTDDKEHSLSDYEDAKLIVLVFTCNHCPVAKAYEDRLVELQKDYKSKGVQVIALNVNNLAADKLEPMKKRATEKEFNFPYIYDPSQKTGRDYGGRVTPHAFVLDGDRKLAYAGAIDDNNSPDKVKAHFVRDALDALLSGKEVAVAETRARGCSIKWDKK